MFRKPIRHNDLRFFITGSLTPTEPSLSSLWGDLRVDQLRGDRVNGWPAGPTNDMVGAAFPGPRGWGEDESATEPMQTVWRNPREAKGSALGIVQQFLKPRL